MEVPEEIEEVVEEAVDTIVPLLQRREVVAALAGAAGLLVGGIGGYILGKRRGTTTVIEGTLEVTEEEFENPNQLKLELDADEYAKIEKTREEAIAKLEAEARAHIPTPTDEMPEPVILRHATIEPYDEDDIVAEVEVEDVEEIPDAPVGRRVYAFATGGNDWDFELEQQRRVGKTAYIIHQDEFLEDDQGLYQTTLTYYERDNILVDEENQPVFNIHDVVGEFQWGRGCNDENVYYYRNVARNAEYEVLRHTGSYAMEVLGIEEDVDRGPNVRKFRQQDD